MSLGQSLQKYTYQYLLQQALAQVPNTVDKREGSIIFDALAPACYVLAEYFMEMHRLAQEISVQTASGEWLDNKVLEVGISRQQATPAIRILQLTRPGASGDVPVTEDLTGKRFASVSDTQPLYYVITGFYTDNLSNRVEGSYLAQCETVGTIGNDYIGTVVPLDFVSNLSRAEIIGTSVTGADTETDDTLRERYLTRVKYRSFGGNVAQYRELARELVIDTGSGEQLAAIGGVQVYPTWQGGGTVKLSVITADFERFDDTALQVIQSVIDPDANGGQGLGVAPIDHRVTVVTPTAFEATISATVSLNGRTLEQVRQEITDAIETYFAELRADWDKGTDLNEYKTVIYQSQIVRAVLSNVPGVADFSNVKINGNSGNITLEHTATEQWLPTLKAVALNEA